MPRLERIVAVRGYELGTKGDVSIAHFARYFEHLRWESSADPAMNLARLFSDGYRMVVRAQQIELSRPVGVGDRLRMALWVGRIGRASMDLWHEARLEKTDELVARGLVAAVYLGRDLRPHVIPEDVRSMVDPAGSSELLAPLCARAPQGAWTGDLHVRHSDLDLFQHVNHAVYASYFDDARKTAAVQGAFGDASGTVGAAVTRAMSIDYRREILVGAPLEIAAWAVAGAPDELGFAIRRKDDGELLSSARVLVHTAR